MIPIKLMGLVKVEELNKRILLLFVEGILHFLLHWAVSLRQKCLYIDEARFLVVGLCIQEGPLVMVLLPGCVVLCGDGLVVGRLIGVVHGD
jgi:hypothetical protein